jgi:hypothetical protein
MFQVSCIAKRRGEGKEEKHRRKNDDKDERKQGINQKKKINEQKMKLY